MKSLLKQKETSGEALFYTLLTYIIGFILAFIITYIYNDYNTVMELGWMSLTWGQVYFSLVAVAFLRIWAEPADRIIENFTNKIQAKEILLVSIAKLFAMFLAAVLYAIVKAFVF